MTKTVEKNKLTVDLLNALHEDYRRNGGSFYSAILGYLTETDLFPHCDYNRVTFPGIGQRISELIYKELYMTMDNLPRWRVNLGPIALPDSPPTDLLYVCNARRPHGLTLNERVHLPQRKETNPLSLDSAAAKWATLLSALK